MFVSYFYNDIHQSLDIYDELLFYTRSRYLIYLFPIDGFGIIEKESLTNGRDWYDSMT